jgi:glycosyltransferase involved in cell wall biosynthesis
MRPLRVAHLTPAYFSAESVIGGGERYVHYIFRALQLSRRFEQCIFVAGSDDKLIEHNGALVRVLRTESPLAGAMNALSTALWRELAGFDLVHIHQCLTNFGAYATAVVRSLGIPSVGTDLGGGENDLMLAGSGMKLLSGIISISQYARSLIERFYDGPHEVLVGPVDTDRFTPQPGAVRDKRTVLCIGRILPHKGIDRLIAALPEGLRLLVVGRVYHESYYELLRGMAQGKEVVFILDADDDELLRLYRTSGLFAQASTLRDVYGHFAAKSELMGLTTLEAMACGLPVVVSDTASLPELVPDPRFGRTFADEDELRDVFRAYMGGFWPGPNAGQAAREHVVANHGIATIGARLARFYDSILAAAH